jgi:TonB family protein
MYAEVMPQFNGGEEELYKFISTHLNYPTLAKENGIEGKTITCFVVEKDGSITNIEVLKKVGFGCDEEAVKLIKQMPKWYPGKIMGKNVRTYFTLPITFLITDPKPKIVLTDSIIKNTPNIETKASFPGGKEAMYNFINKKVNYPEVAKMEGIQGKVLVKFFVETSGEISDIKNIGKKVEVNLRYGLGHLCKEKMTFFVQGDIHSDYIKISSEIELSSPHRSASSWNPLNYNFIVSAKYINS